MQPLATFCSSQNAPVGYQDRPTVKAVVMDEGQKQVLLFSGSLLGGGVENGETDEEALKRECLEEAGISIEIIKPLGTVIQFRDILKKRYEVHGFLVRHLEKLSEPTDMNEGKKRRVLLWRSIPDAISMLKTSIESIEQIREAESFDDSSQARLYNAKMALIFLEQAEKDL